MSRRPEKQYVSIETLAAYACCGKMTCCFPCCFPGESSERSWCETIWGGVFVKPYSLVHSYFFRSRTITIWRTVMFLWATMVIALDLSVRWRGGFWFAYLTNLSYIGLWWYFLIAMILSIYYQLTKKKLTVKRNPNWFEVFVSWTYTAQFTIHLVVPGVYWAYQVEGKFKDFLDDGILGQFTGVAMHGVSTLMFLVELTMNRVIFVWGHLVILLGTLVVYLAWCLNTGKIWPNEGPNRNGYPYAFLNPDDPQSNKVLVGVCFAAVGAFVFSFMVHWIRAAIGNCYKPREVKPAMTETPAT